MTAVSSVEAQARLQANLLQIWGRLLESTDLSIDDDFFDKGGDSLLATEMMLELERLVGKPVPETLLFETSTIRTLTDKLTQTQKLELKPAVKIGKVFNGGTPLLFFHGDWTAGGFYVQNLARKLGPELSVIAIAPHGTRDQPMLPSIEAMAAERLPAILDAQSNGPYRLGGHCVGAAVAFETARLLMARGEQVELVAMVEPLWIVDGEFLKLPQTSSIQSNEAVTPANVDSDPIILEEYRECLLRYSPAPLSASLIIFSSEFDGRPWSQLGSDCELFEVAGGHYDWITIRADNFADKLKSRLLRARTAVEGQNGG